MGFLRRAGDIRSVSDGAARVKKIRAAGGVSLPPAAACGTIAGILGRGGRTMNGVCRGLLAVLLLATGLGTLAAQGLHAGAAPVDITPPVGYAMWGYGARHDAPSLGVLDPLQARAVVLAAGN